MSSPVNRLVGVSSACTVKRLSTGVTTCEKCVLLVCCPPRPYIGGAGLTEEIDESLFARRKYNRGRRVREQWVFGGICRETKDAFMYAVPDRTAAPLLPIIRACIRPGTHIMSDEWRAYGQIGNQLNIMGQPLFQHSTVNHSVNFVDPATGTHTQNIESYWCKAKQRNKKQWGTARTTLDSHMCEFMWRKRLNGADPFRAMLQDIATFFPPA